MSKCAAKLTTTGGSTTLPLCALVGSATSRLRLIELGIFNTSTSTAVDIGLCRITTAGTPGTAATSRLTDGGDGATIAGVLRNSYTGTPPTLTDLGIGFWLPPSGSIAFTWPDNTIATDNVAASAIGLIMDAGTATALKVYTRWLE